jgi:hypothetical protein
MRILSAARVLAPVLLAVSCAPQAALTPQAAFHDLKEAFRTSDAAALERQLSAGSVKKIRRMASLVSRMDERQRAALAVKLGVSGERLGRLAVRDWCAFTLAADAGGGGLRAAAAANIVGVDSRGDRATVRVDNGMAIPFVKEGPYWKLDMMRL